MTAPLLMALRDKEKVSSLSTRLSSMVRIPTSLLLSPAAKLRVELGAMKSKPEKAVPLLAERLSEWAVLMLPVRLTKAYKVSPS